MANTVKVPLPNGHEVEIMRPAADYENLVDIDGALVNVVVVQDEYLENGSKVVERFQIPVADLPAGGQ